MTDQGTGAQKSADTNDTSADRTYRFVTSDARTDLVDRIGAILRAGDFTDREKLRAATLAYELYEVRLDVARRLRGGASVGGVR